MAVTHVTIVGVSGAAPDKSVMTMEEMQKEIKRLAGSKKHLPLPDEEWAKPPPSECSCVVL